MRPMRIDAIGFYSFVKRELYLDLLICVLEASESCYLNHPAIYKSTPKRTKIALYKAVTPCLNSIGGRRTNMLTYRTALVQAR
jgi:hypothetical protein